jgi:hypothetical protein
LRQNWRRGASKLRRAFAALMAEVSRRGELILPLVHGAAGIERIRFAALKLCRGDLSALQRAVGLAKKDWRDVLVAAGFESDVAAHRSWWPDPPQS